MDYVFWSAVFRYMGLKVTVSYDIICQWYRNLDERILNLPTHLRRLELLEQMRYAIPKFHISGHGPKCQSKFSFNFLPFMARTDGENIERGWAWMNPASLSTREMGPGARRDTLDCQWSAWNWCILTRLGKYYCYRPINTLTLCSTLQVLLCYEDFTPQSLKHAKSGKNTLNSAKLSLLKTSRSGRLWWKSGIQILSMLLIRFKNLPQVSSTPLTKNRPLY